MQAKSGFSLTAWSQRALNGWSLGPLLGPLLGLLLGLLLILLLGFLAGCSSDSPGPGGPQPLPVDDSGFADPVPIPITGYDSDIMEPFVTRDGRYLLFNNLNQAPVNTNLHYARFTGSSLEFMGELSGVNTTALEGVASLANDGMLYFVSTRSYDQTLSTLYRGSFSDGAVTGVELVAGVSPQVPGMVNFDAEISADGNTLYFVDGLFDGSSVPVSADLVIATRSGDSFTRLANSDAILAAVNGDALEYAPAISADQLELFFTRLDQGVSADAVILRSVRSAIGEPFSTPVVLEAITGFVEGPTLSPDERDLFYHRRDGNRFVLYRVHRP